MSCTVIEKMVGTERNSFQCFTNAVKSDDGSSLEIVSKAVEAHH